MRSFLLLGFLLSIPALLCHPTPDFWSDTPADTLSETLAAGMSDSELVGQLLLLGYMGTDPSPEFLEWIGTYGIGGIKIFGWNAESLYGLAAAISTMQRMIAADPPRFPPRRDGPGGRCVSMSRRIIDTLREPSA
jgi:hypothetical protein